MMIAMCTCRGIGNDRDGVQQISTLTLTAARVDCGGFYGLGIGMLSFRSVGDNRWDWR